MYSHKVTHNKAVALSTRSKKKIQPQQQNDDKLLPNQVI